jgi:predicted house-cleaning noncanonical NTP pyrophosphatase (MazG superfamily)
VEEYVHSLARAYSGKIPEFLDDMVLEELQKLIGLRIVKYVDSRSRPDPMFDKPRP